MLSTRPTLFWLTTILLWLVTGEPARPQPAEAESQQLIRSSTPEPLHRQLQRFDQELDLRLARFERNGCADAGQQIERLQARLELLESELQRAPSTTAEPLRNKLRLLRNRLSDLHTAARRDGFSRPAPLGKAGGARQGPGAPPNDDCADAIAIGTGTFFGDTSQATNDGQTSCGSSLFSPDVWFKLVFEQTGTLFVNTFGSSYDTVLSAHSECPGTVGNTFACDDDTLGLDSAVGVFAFAGDERWIRVSGFDGEAGPFTLEVGSGGEITGTVVDAVTAEPLAGVAVELWDGDGYSAGSTSSGPDGGYAFGGLAPGVYFATSRNYQGYLDELYDDLPCPGGGGYYGGCDPTTGAPIVVEIATATADIDFALDRGGAISGLVIDASTGEGAVGARVRTWDSAGSYLQSTFTDDSGVYAFSGLAPGTYFASTDTSDFADELYDDLPCPGGAFYGCEPTDGTPIGVEINTTTSGIDFVLDRLGAIAGTVTETSSGPLSGVRVEVWTASGSYVGSDHSDSFGAYSVGGLTTGSYVVVADGSNHADELYDDLPCPGGAPYGCDLTTGTPVAADINGTTSGIDFVLDRLGAFSGTVTEAATGDPIVSMRVEVWSSGGSYLGSDYTDAAGVYTADRLAAGSYFAIAGDYYTYVNELYDDLPCPGGAPYGCDPTTGTPIAVELNATTSDIDFEIVRKGAISGLITDETTGDPIASVQVEIRSSTGSYAASASTDAAGTYTADGLDDGTYYAVSRPSSSSDYFDQLYDQLPCGSGCNPTAGTPIAVAAGSVAEDIDFTLSRGGAITGIVTEVATGDPVTSGRVQIWDAAGAFIGDDYLDGSGSYRIGRLSAGTYFARTNVYSQHRNELYDDLPCPYDSCSPTTGTAIEVTLGETVADIDFALDRLAAISGTVTDAVTGQPVSYGRVEIYDAGGSYAGDAYFYSSGSYTVEGLAAGTYFARTSIYSSDYVDQLYDGLPCGQPCLPTTGTPVEVSLGSTTEGIDFALDRRGGISGIVTDASTGEPIAGTRVEIWRSDGDYARDVYTDTAGRYTAGGLLPGAYFATTDSPGYDDELFDDLPCVTSCDPTQGSPIQVASNSTTRHIDFALNRSGSISGTVTHAPTGEPISGLRVRIFGATGSSVASAYSAAAGDYTVSGLQPGVYFALTDHYDVLNQLYDGLPCPAACDSTSGTPIQVSPHADTPGIDFRLDRLGAISGTVTEAATGTPIANLSLRIWDQDGNDVGSGYTDGSGTYSAGRLLPGVYYASTDHYQFRNEVFDDLPCGAGGCDPTSGTQIAVQLNATTGGIDFALDRLGAISGNVTDASTGLPVSGIRVEIWNSDSNYVGSRNTDGAGNYTLDRLVPDIYFASTDNYQSYLDELYEDIPCLGGAPAGCEPDKGTPIRVLVDATTEDIDFELIPVSTGISGVATEAATGAPRANVIVDIWDASGLHVTSVATAASGGYYASLPPGTYFASTDHGVAALVEEVWDGVLCPGSAYLGLCDPTAGGPIVVEESGVVGVAGVTAGIDFTLEPALAFEDGFESGDLSVWSSVVGGP